MDDAPGSRGRGVMIAVTVIVWVWVGKERLARVLAEAMGTLDGEMLDADVGPPS